MKTVKWLVSRLKVSPNTCTGMQKMAMERKWLFGGNH